MATSIAPSFRILSLELSRSPPKPFLPKSRSSSFLPRSPISFQRLQAIPHPGRPSSGASSVPQQNSSAGIELDSSVLPPKLREIVGLFRSVEDSRAKFEQLLHYATQLPLLDPRFKTEDNRVRGCVSRVWVRAFPDPADPSAVRFEADSDSSLTKGLAALLVFGLSGSTAAAVTCLPPEFVMQLGLRQSLTESRNNGFLNILRLMQKKALQLADLEEYPADSGVSRGEDLIFRMNGLDAGANASNSTSSSAFVSRENADPDLSDIRAGHEHSPNGTSGDADSSDGLSDDDHIVNWSPEASQSTVVGLGRRRGRMMEVLDRELMPMRLEVEDISMQHAGHAAVKGNSDGETHFNVSVVSMIFEGKTLIKRHRIVYDLLQDELQSGLHALSIVAKAPSEVQPI